MITQIELDIINQRLNLVALSLGFEAPTRGARGPYFTGLKDCGWGSAVGRFTDDQGLVGQVVQWVERERRVAVYVNLPDMNIGEVQEGATIDIGTKRIFPPVEDEAIKLMLVEAREKLRFWLRLDGAFDDAQRVF